MTDFDKIYDRKSHGSVKWNKYEGDIIPLWVADMDFAVAQPIQDSLENYKNTAIYGYARVPEKLAEVIIDRFKNLYDWEVKREWIVWTPSVVSGIFITSKMVSKSDCSVMTATPVYPPFIEAAKLDGRNLQDVPLLETEAGGGMDFEKMVEIADTGTKLYILCNPNNPTGKMFDKDELEKLVDFCTERNILICSDEIHADLIMDPNRKHVPVASISEKAAMNTINLFSPGKTYNIPGLNTGFAIIPNPELRVRFEKEMANIVPHMSLLAGRASIAAYAESSDWLDEVLDYLRSNQEYLFNEINQIPGLKMNKAAATYLAWIDYRGLGIDDFANYLEKYGVGVMEAHLFNGAGHVRLNFATQRANLEEAVKRIKRAVNDLAD